MLGLRDGGQVSIFALGTFAAASEDKHHCGVQAGGIGTGIAFWNNDLDEALPAGAIAVRQLVRI